MGITNLGAVGMSAGGVYNPETVYKKYKVVSANGGSYMYINPTPAAGVSVTETSHWQQIAAKGDTGPQGEQGIPGDVESQAQLDGINAQLDDILNKSSITTTHQFADNTARDAYFTTNPTELVENLYIGVGTGYQQYLSGSWVVKTAVLTVLDDVMYEQDQAWEV